MVDADACPVKDEILYVSRKFNVQPIFVSSYNHFSPAVNNDSKWVYVDTDREAVDMYIANNAMEDDVVITQDIGLASLVLKRGGYVLSPRGKIYREQEIEQMLQLRFLRAKQRRQGIYAKGPKQLSQKDRFAFIQSLEKILSKLAGNLD